LFAVLILQPQSVFSQITFSKLSVGFGLIKNQQLSYTYDEEFAYYPEISLGGLFYEDYLEWECYLGAWSEFGEYKHWTDQLVNHSYSGIHLGSRFVLFPQKTLKQFPFSINFVGGISSHLIWQNKVDSDYYYGPPTEDNFYIIITGDIGLGLNVSVTENYRIRLDGIVNIPFNPNEKLWNKGISSSLVLKLDYFFKNNKQ